MVRLRLRYSPERILKFDGIQGELTIAFGPRLRFGFHEAMISRPDPCRVSGHVIRKTRSGKV